MKNLFVIFVLVALFVAPDAFAQKKQDKTKKDQTELAIPNGTPVKGDVEVRKSESSKQLTSVQKRADVMTKKLDNQLSLTDDQSTKIHAINLSTAQKVSELRAARKDSPVGFKKEMKKVWKDHDQSLKAVFTASQNKQYNAIKEKIRENH